MFLLLIMITYGDTYVVEHMEFKTIKACSNAQQRIKKVPYMGRIKTMCFKK